MYMYCMHVTTNNKVFIMPIMINLVDVRRCMVIGCYFYTWTIYMYFNTTKIFVLVHNNYYNKKLIKTLIISIIIISSFKAVEIIACFITCISHGSEIYDITIILITCT